MESNSSVEETATAPSEVNVNSLVSPSENNETVANITSLNTNQRKKKLRVQFKKQRKHKKKSATTECPQNNLDNANEKPKMINECAICMMSFQGKWIGTPQHCKHHFCLSCLKKWSEVKSSCPLDRKKFNWIAVRKEIGGKVVKKVSCFKKLKRNNSTEMLTQSELFTIGYALNNLRSQITNLGGLL